MDNVISQLDNVLVTKEDMALTVQVIHISSIVMFSIMYDLPFSISYIILFWTEFDCPGDGTCSNQGTCDDTTGTCECDFGYEGNTCQGTLMKKMQLSPNLKTIYNIDIHSKSILMILIGKCYF